MRKRVIRFRIVAQNESYCFIFWFLIQSVMEFFSLFFVEKKEKGYIFRRGAAVAQVTVNHLVAGSNPAAGALKFEA